MTSKNPNSAPNNQTANADAKSTDKSETKSQLPPTGRVPLIQAPPASHAYQITCDKKKDGYDKVKFWAEILGILFLIIYTYETCRTNNLTQDALTQSKNQFRQDQRPYVWLLGGHMVDMPPAIVADGERKGKVGAAYHFANYGKSPALEVRSEGQIAIGDKECSELKEGTIASGPGEFIPPGDNTYQSARFNYAYSDIIPTQEVVNGMAAGDIPVVVFGHFEYTDGQIPKRTYIGDFCTMIYVVPNKLPTKDYCQGHIGVREK